MKFLLNKQPYLKSKCSSTFFHSRRIKFENFYESERYFLTSEYIKPDMEILDIGCASGGLGASIKSSIEQHINYTGIDIDMRAIDLGKKNFTDLNFMAGSYPEDLPAKMYDMIIVFNLFEQVPDWKSFLKSLTANSKKYINIGITLKMTGATIIDKDVSFGYYFDSGIRVFKIVHNIYEVFNYCCIEELRIKKISFYGYHVDRPASAAGDFRPLAQRDQIRGNLFLELYPKEHNISRFGGIGDTEILQNFDMQKQYIIRPEMDIIIDSKSFEL